MQHAALVCHPHRRAFGAVARPQRETHAEAGDHLKSLRVPCLRFQPTTCSSASAQDDRPPSIPPALPKHGSTEVGRHRKVCAPPPDCSASGPSAHQAMPLSHRASVGAGRKWAADCGRQERCDSLQIGGTRLGKTDDIERERARGVIEWRGRHDVRRAHRGIGGGRSGRGCVMAAHVQAGDVLLSGAGFI